MKVCVLVTYMYISPLYVDLNLVSPVVTLAGFNLTKPEEHFLFFVQFFQYLEHLNLALVTAPIPLIINCY